MNNKRWLFFLLLLFPFSLSAQSENETVHRLRLNLSGGGFYFLASTKDAKQSVLDLGVPPQKVDSYYKNLKWGESFNADIHYLFCSNWGVGVKYFFFTTGAKMKDIGINAGDGLHMGLGDIEETMYVNFVGPSVFNRNFLNAQETFSMNSTLSVGYTSYRDEAFLLGYPQLITGGNLGFYASFGFEYFVSRHVAVGCDLGAFFFSMGKIKINDGSVVLTENLDKQENLSNLSLSLGIRVYL